MANIFGTIGLSDTDRVFAATRGQSVVYDIATQYFEQHNQEMAQFEQLFVEMETDNHTMRYKLPGAGRLQRRGIDSQTGAVKVSGSWDVAFPLEDFGAQLAGNDVAIAYMTAAELSQHMLNIRIQDRNTRRFEIFKALFNNTARTFVDPLWGSLTVRPLAIGSTDSVLYPPVEGSETEATAQHYLESNYAASAISNTNNPYNTLGALLESHFGLTQGFSNIVFFVNPAQVALSIALADFDDTPVNYVRYGDDRDVAVNMPTGLPGRILGRMRYGWLVEWSWIPANYVLAIHLGAPKPLMKRIDPADTGLGTGLQLIAQVNEYPFIQWHYRNRFGFGVGNRLSAAVMELGTGGTYTIPTAYA